MPVRVSLFFMNIEKIPVKLGQTVFYPKDTVCAAKDLLRNEPVKDSAQQ